MMTPQQIIAFKAALPNAMENEPMAQHTSFRIGGPARLYLVAASSEETMHAIETADALNIPWAVYGGGSNLLVMDEGYEGVVIQVANRGITHHTSRNMMEVEAGAVSALVARKATEAGLAGFEWAVGLPGTIGGAVFGDAGCFGGEMRDSVASVDAYRVKDKTRVRLTNAECRFGYRDSLFKHEPHVIFGCELQLAPAADPAASKAKLEEIMRERKAKQPINQSSAGCIFKNYDFQDEKELEMLKRSVEVPGAMLASKRLAAGWLIDQAGLLGYELGTAAVSQAHGNFFVNKSHARAQDIVALISLVKMKIRDTFGIELQEEVQYLGFS